MTFTNCTLISWLVGELLFLLCIKMYVVYSLYIRIDLPCNSALWFYGYNEVSTMTLKKTVSIQLLLITSC